MSKLKGKLSRCLDLRLASYIVGSAVAVISVVAMGCSIYIMGRYDSPDFRADQNDQDSLASIPFRGFVIALLFAAFTLFVSLLLLRGIYLNRENFVMPFVLWIGLLVGIALVRALLGFITSAVHGEEFSSVAMTFLINLAEGVVGLVLFLPVYVFYSKMDVEPYYPAITEKI